MTHLEHGSHQVITRFAPSPTGHLHAGGYRTAFFSYLYAKKHGGSFILRIEDTDKERSDPKYTQEILSVFERIGISYDKKYIQSEHQERHQRILEELIEKKYAYISHEPAKDGSGVMREVVRFRNPGKKVTFDDLIRGKIETDVTDLGDFVIARSISEPLFHLAVVVDDHDAGVTHVIRAEEHIANTPRQILIYEALGWAIPHYAHLPLVLAPDKTKMSKRKGAVPVIEYLERGFLPEAVLNAICLCGWNPGTDQELFSRAELEQLFDLAQVQKSGAVFNEEKLKWFNREYIKKLDYKILSETILHELPSTFLQPLSASGKEVLIRILSERIDYFGQIKEFLAAGELGYLDDEAVRRMIHADMLVWKKSTLEATHAILGELSKLLATISETDWTETYLRQIIMPIAEERGKGDVLWPLRVALSGMQASPDPFSLLIMLGKDRSLARINHARAL